MNNRYGDDRGGDRWQGRNEGGNRGQDDRGFFDRAGDEVRSWFGDDDAERRREQDERRWERERGMTGQRDNQYGSDRYDDRSNFGGFGNQTGESWNRDRPGVSYTEHSSSGGWGSEHGSSDRNRERSSSSRGQHRDYGLDRSANSNWGAASNSRSESRYGNTGGGDRGSHGNDHRSEHRYGDFTSAGGGGGGGPEVFGERMPGGTSGFGGTPDHGRRFDRVDPGHVGSQGAHPMSSPVGGAYGAGYGVAADGGAGSSARYYGQMHQGGSRGTQMAGSQGGGMTAGSQGSSSGGMSGGGMGGGMGMGGGGRQHDPHYSEWRSRQIQSLDQDYDEYRREHQSKFEQDFGNWRTRRGEQRSSLGRVTEHMEVMGSDGQKIGVVDKVRGDRIILTRNDENAGGVHHSIPCSWIESVDERVTVNKSREEAMRQWQDEDRNRALFEREDQGSEGPHILNRSFSGTYGKDD